MGRVSGKVALVTGGAKGIGRACAMMLAQEGAAVVVTDIQTTVGRECAAEIVKAGGEALFLEHDTTSEDAWIAVMAEIRSRFGKLHILVNNAGIAVPGLVTDMSLESWRRQHAVNVEGVFLGVKHALPSMRESGGGSIVNISSVAGFTGVANLSSYCASKGAVRLFTKAVAMECAAARDGGPLQFRPSRHHRYGHLGRYGRRIAGRRTRRQPPGSGRRHPPSPPPWA